MTAVSGVDETLDLELVAAADEVPLRKAGLGGPRVVGVAALAGGIWAVAVDGDEIAVRRRRERRLRPLPVGAQHARAGAPCSSGVGAAAATLGGVWLYLGGGARPARRSAPPDRDLGVSGRF